MGKKPDVGWPDLEEPGEALERLAGCEAPVLIGVRHHSPACAAAMPALLKAARPTALLLELPELYADWIQWLAHEDTEAPVALAATHEHTGDLSFYPFADFSPELAAVRWARARDVPVVCFDLDGGADISRVGGHADRAAPSVLERLLSTRDLASSEALWDELVEARSPGSTPEQVRRAALLQGWMLRADDARGPGISRGDLQRETRMRERLAGAHARGERTVAVVGAYHTPALLPEPTLWRAVEPDAPGSEADRGAWISSLVPYDFALLDSRSGYPAGIRDPQLRQRVWEVLGGPQAAPQAMDAALADVVVRLCRHIRRAGHVAGVPDGAEAQRMMRDLARLRGLPAPGRRELLESLQSALGQGEPLGRGRVIARALEDIVVGQRRGRLPAGAPRSGLRRHVDGVLSALRLPDAHQPGTDAVTLRLDPLRSGLDRRREVALQRLAACGVPYGTLQAGSAAGGVETLTRVWSVAWQPATGATLELAGLRGVTLVQAVEGVLRQRRHALDTEDQLTTRARLTYLEAAADAGLGRLCSEWMTELLDRALAESGLAELVDSIVLLERIRRGHVPALPRSPSQAEPPEVPAYALPAGATSRELLRAAVRHVEGLAGSERLEDAQALLELVRLRQDQLADADGSRAKLDGDARLGWALAELAAEGSDLMRGAAGALCVQLEREPVTTFAERMGSWVDGAMDPEGQARLSLRLRGALVVSSALFEADARFCEGIFQRVEQLMDTDFLRRLPALRHGFEVLSPADRQRLLGTLGERFEEEQWHGKALDAELSLAPELLARYAGADQAGLEALRTWGVEPQILGGVGDMPTPVRSGDANDVDAPVATDPPVAPDATATPAHDPPHQLSARDRWRLILGRETRQLPRLGRRAASALEELYGAGQGEGSGSDDGQGGGKEAAFPTARQWAEELEALFGESVREEVLGRAAAGDHPAAVLELDPDRVRPSMELLEQVLSLKGGLPEAHLPRLRRLVRRIVADLVKVLATRVRPALTGVTTPRPTRRPGGPLDLRQTLAANLKHVRRLEDGRTQIIPEQLIFRARGRRALDWQLQLLVDVSGSMEPSVIYAALMAAILSGMPALSVQFVTFSTEVVDLSEHVSDPLALLLEVSVGGGTHIAKALRYARERMRVPSRTLVLVVSDFDEGFSVAGLLAEVRALVGTGATGLGLAALDDGGKPRFNRAVAEQVAAAGMPVAALTPLELARWVGEQIR